jgi:hypothetical protein
MATMCCSNELYSSLRNGPGSIGLLSSACMSACCLLSIWCQKKYLAMACHESRMISTYFVDYQNLRCVILLYDRTHHIEIMTCRMTQL